ncbi:MAG: type II secretion system minor pseudopilin GspH [Mariprofundus sp.]|nr:type II secretion system minor pseudopilin GspH [Mariprofundus sp.]
MKLIFSPMVLMGKLAVAISMLILVTGNRVSLINTQQARGFTLLEIMLVLVIMSVMTMMVAPSFFSATATTVEQQARRLIQVLRLAADEAVLTGRPLRWTARAHSYAFEQPDGEGAWQVIDEPPFAAYQLPDMMRIVEIQPLDSTLGEASDQLTSEQEKEPIVAHMMLLPEGISAVVTIVLNDAEEGGNTLSIELRPGPGGIALKKGQQ